MRSFGTGSLTLQMLKTMLNHLMIVYPVLIIRNKTNPGPGSGRIFPPILDKIAPNPVIFSYCGIVLWTRVPG